MFKIWYKMKIHVHGTISYQRFIINRQRFEMLAVIYLSTEFLLSFHAFGTEYDDYIFTLVSWDSWMS